MQTEPEKPEPEYTVIEVVRSAGLLIRPVPYGGVSVAEMVLSVGPLATDRELLELASRYVELPARIRPRAACECVGDLQIAQH